MKPEGWRKQQFKLTMKCQLIFIKVNSSLKSQKLMLFINNIEQFSFPPTKKYLTGIKFCPYFFQKVFPFVSNPPFIFYYLTFPKIIRKTDNQKTTFKCKMGNCKQNVTSEKLEFFYLTFKSFLVMKEELKYFTIISINQKGKYENKMKIRFSLQICNIFIV